MKKLVIKTVFITIIAILTVCVAVMSAICIFKPKVIAKMFDDLGNYQASQYFYEMQYNKTKDIDDLLVLIENADENQNNEELVFHVGRFIGHKDFKSYCQTQNNNLSADEMNTEDYYARWYTKLLVEDGNFEGAVEFAKSYVLKTDNDVNMGYTKDNPFRVLVKMEAELSADKKQTLKNAISDCKNIITDSMQLGYINADLNDLN